MNCQDAERAILLDAAGELHAKRRTDLRNHMAECGACRTYAADLHDLQRLVKDGTPDAPEQIVGPVLILGGQRPVRAGGVFGRHGRAALALAAGLALCFGIWQTLQREHIRVTRSEESPGSRIAAISAFLHAMGNQDAMAEAETETATPVPVSDLESLAEQILATQGLDTDFAAEIGEVVSLFEEHQPTSLRWRSNPALPAGKCG